MTDEMLQTFRPYLDAADVDLKGFREGTHRAYTGAHVQPVLEMLKGMRSLGIWAEVTTLVVPGVNDDPGELCDIAAFVAQELGVDVPWYVSRFHPTYKLIDRPPAPVATLRRARDIGYEAGLHYVYVGNVWEESSEDTHCPGSGTRLVRRHGFSVRSNRLSDGRCPDCGAAIAGVWDWDGGQGA